VLGPIDENKLNVNGGAIALGHPVGASGARLVLTVLNELARRRATVGLATMCVGGGQAAPLSSSDSTMVPNRSSNGHALVLSGHSPLATDP